MTISDTTVTTDDTGAIEAGQRLPWVRLPLAAGGDLTFSAYRGRANLALYVLPDADDPALDACLVGVAARLPDYRAQHTQPLAIVGGPLATARAIQARLTLPFPLAADPTGAIIARLAPRAADGRPLPAALLTDRYAEVRTLLTGWPTLHPDRQTDLLDWLTYIDCLCSV